MTSRRTGSRPVLLFLATMVAALAGCLGRGQSIGTPLPTNLGSDEINRMATDFVDALNRRVPGADMGPVLDRWADDFEHTVSLATMRTKEDLREFFDGWLDLFTEWKLEEMRRIVQGRYVVWEGIGKGVHRSTGRPIRLPMVMIMRFDRHGKAKMVHVYFDTAVIQRQLVEAS